jgi:hypothetical protein
VNNNIDSKYFGHNRKEDIAELENLSNLFVIISEYDENKDILEVITGNLPILRFIWEILTILVTLFVGYQLAFINLNLDNFGISLPFNPKIILIGFLILIIITSFKRKLSNMRKMNKIVIDFKNKLLTVKNLDFVGKHFIENVDYDFYEIKSFRIRKVASRDRFYSRSAKSILVIDKKDDIESPLFVFRAIRFFKFNEKRFVDLLNGILRV